VRVVGCEFDGNIADSGGAIYVVDADLSIGDSVFTDNAAARFAGAVRTGGDGVVVSIVGATFENNDALDGNGGAIDHSGAGAIVEVFDSVFSGNTATSTGAAIFANLASDVTLLRCGFFDNVAVGTGSEDTGGAYISGTARVLVEDCDFERNLAPGSGGGLRFNNSSGSVVGSRFIGNEASRGGAILVVGNGLDVSIFNSKFSGNSARRQGADTNTGGAVSASGTTSGPNLSVYNSLFTGNTAVSAGAIEVASFADAVINNCTFVDNDADAIGGAIRRASTTATTVVNSSLAWDNVPSGSQIAIGGSGLDEVNFSLVEGGYSAVGIGNIDADPLFVDAANGDYSLSAGSPAIDAGSSARYGAGPLSDLAGGVRGRDDPATADTGEAVFGAVIDIGAFEFAPAGDDPVDTCPADIDGDGLIELDDLLAVLSDFGTACP
jgi:hypothetical protein